VTPALPRIPVILTTSYADALGEITSQGLPVLVKEDLEVRFDMAPIVSAARDADRAARDWLDGSLRAWLRRLDGRRRLRRSDRGYLGSTWSAWASPVSFRGDG